MPRFTLPASAPIQTTVGEKWALLPLRIPTGWHVKLNQIDARRLSTGEIELNDSEDLFWAVYSHPRTGDMQIHVDAGWYRDVFRIDRFHNDRDHMIESYHTVFPDDFVWTLEKWLLAIANGEEI